MQVCYLLICTVVLCGWMMSSEVWSQLTRSKVADSALRMHRIPHETRCHPDISLHDVLLELQRAGKREEHRFFSRLAQKIPLLHVEWTELSMA